MKLKKSSVVIIAILCCLTAGVVSAILLYKSQDAEVLKFKKYIKYTFLNKQIPTNDDETVGLESIKRVELYEDNSLVAREKLDFLKDNKKVYITEKAKRLVDYPKGYMIDLPTDIKLDFTYSPIFNTVKTNEFEAVISREYSPYEDIDWYIGYYLNNFILNNDYQKANNIKLLEKTNQTINGNQMEIISAVINNLDSSKYDAYTYVTIKTNTRLFYRIMFKYHSDNFKFRDKIQNMLSSFKYFQAVGDSSFDLDFKPIVPENWSEETKQIYNTIKNSDKLRWGIFSKDIYGVGINQKIPNLEKEINYKFPVILSYMHFTHDFPMEFMKKNYSDGRLVELTYQITQSNNENLTGYTPNIDIYRGIKDDEIRKLAKSAKEFGHTFLFRLNNEMNSDWTSYSGVTNMSDPEIFIENWKRFYNIFKEEGVNNVIWIFNPNDRNHPPCDWNDFLAYYPGNEYVQMIGVTGYNNGTYYKEESLEDWREFEDIYDLVQKAYQPFFSEFPWIITEFSSSSIGGDKAKWIDNMFGCIDKYKNIKIAVWFDYADYDYKPGKENIAARPYWLDETPQTTAAFKRGIEKNGLQGWGN